MLINRLSGFSRFLFGYSPFTIRRFAIFEGVIMFLRYTTEDENVGQVANLSYAQAIF